MKLMLAHNYVDQDVKEWWMSEKLDGIRAYWDGTQFFSRTEKEIKAPKAFLDEMPKDMCLDGELCCGRGKFNETSSIVRKTKDVDKYTDEWLNKITYHVFDTPNTNTFEVRMAELYDKVGEKYDNIEIVKQIKIYKKSDVENHLKKIINLGGEGLMLRKFDSPYESKRSKSLLKVKEFHDMEVIIIGYKEGTGKYTGKLGSYECETKEGKKFNCGSGLDDDMREERLDVGVFITVKYFELSKEGVPRFPVFLRKAERQEF